MTLQQILDLPDENVTKNPGRDIKEPILNAIAEISEMENGDIVIEPMYNTNGNIIEFLEEGYARISLHNEYLDYFGDLAKTKKAKIENTMKKREEIAEKAKIKALANKIEKDEKSKIINAFSALETNIWCFTPSEAGFTDIMPKL